MTTATEVAAETEIEVFDKWLPVKLTNSETIERARTLSQRHREKEEVEAAKSSVNREYTEKLKSLAGEISRLSKIVAEGEEERNVQCKRFKKFLDKKVETIRLDTNQVIENRIMHDYELQTTLKIDSPVDPVEQEDF